MILAVHTDSDLASKPLGPAWRPVNIPDCPSSVSYRHCRCSEKTLELPASKSFQCWLGGNRQKHPNKCFKVPVSALKNKNKNKNKNEPGDVGCCLEETAFALRLKRCNGMQSVLSRSWGRLFQARETTKANPSKRRRKVSDWSRGNAQGPVH